MEEQTSYNPTVDTEHCMSTGSVTGIERPNAFPPPLYGSMCFMGVDGPLARDETGLTNAMLWFLTLPP